MIPPRAPAPYSSARPSSALPMPVDWSVRPHDEQRQAPDTLAQQAQRGAREAAAVVLGDPAAAGIGGQDAPQAHVSRGRIGPRRRRHVQPPLEILERRPRDLVGRADVLVSHRAHAWHRRHDRSRAARLRRDYSSELASALLSLSGGVGTGVTVAIAVGDRLGLGLGPARPRLAGPAPAGRGRRPRRRHRPRELLDLGRAQLRLALGALRGALLGRPARARGARSTAVAGSVGRPAWGRPRARPRGSDRRSQPRRPSERCSLRRFLAPGSASDGSCSTPSTAAGALAPCAGPSGLPDRAAALGAAAALPGGRAASGRLVVCGDRLDPDGAATGDRGDREHLGGHRAAAREQRAAGRRARGAAGRRAARRRRRAGSQRARHHAVLERERRHDRQRQREHLALVLQRRRGTRGSRRRP